MAAVGELDTVIATVQDVRDNIDTHHSRWFLTTSEMSQVGVEPSVPEDVVCKSTAVMYQLTPQQSTIDIPSPSRPPPLRVTIPDLVIIIEE